MSIGLKCIQSQCYFLTVSNKKAPMLSLFDEESKIVTSGLGNHKFRVAGMAGIAWHNLNLVDARIKLLIKFTEYHFSKVSIKYVKLWVGLN